MKTVSVIGAGLAGCEAAFALSHLLPKYTINLYDIKPSSFTPAHKYKGFSELVCSNSLKSESITTATGLLKAEATLLGSLIMEAAAQTKVPAGGALSVDREKFSDYITEKIKEQPNINFISKEVTFFPEKNTIIAPGPLATNALSNCITEKLDENLYFYDAAAPIITAKSIDTNIAFFAARYDKGTPDYINCPFTKEEYDVFYNELITGETAPLSKVDKLQVYEGCMPVEVLAKRGYDSLRFGCMKPVGLYDPKKPKEKFYAVIQLRSENRENSLYNIVGFQTNLKFPEQKRIFSLIPGLKEAEFVRYGVMHRNTFLNSPKFLDNFFYLKNSFNIFFAGQITGVEGYVPSAVSGIVAAFSLAYKIWEQTLLPLPKTSIVGALAEYISNYSGKDFQPLGPSMGILPPLEEDIPRKILKNKQEKYKLLAERSLADIKLWRDNLSSARLRKYLFWRKTI